MSWYASVPTVELAEAFKKFTDQIDKKDLQRAAKATNPIETDLHFTVKAGLDNPPTQVQQEDVRKSLCLVNGAVEVQIDGLDAFENKGEDVLYAKVVLTDSLRLLCSKLGQATDKEHPHVTIAYVQNGLGKKYAKQFGEFKTSFKVNKYHFTKFQQPDSRLEFTMASSLKLGGYNIPFAHLGLKVRGVCIPGCVHEDDDA